MKESQMNGAECLLQTMLANNVDLCLMNPGTSEMQFVSALDRVPEMRGVLCLFEGVCSGAADGYARMTGKPAATLLHLGPGLANALANLHNARKARSPVVNIVGEHSTQHLVYDAPLTADIEGFARPVSGWVRTVEQATAMGEAASAAVAAALGPPGQVATLIVPADYSWSDAGAPGCPARKPSRMLPGTEQVREIARALRSGQTMGILLGGSALHERGIRAADRLRAATGARIFANRNGARLARGGDIPVVERIPYFPEYAQALLAPMQRLILVEARPPVSFFGYPGLRGALAPPDCAFDVLASEEQDGAGALEWLAEEIGAPDACDGRHTASRLAHRRRTHCRRHWQNRERAGAGRDHLFRRVGLFERSSLAEPGGSGQARLSPGYGRRHRPGIAGGAGRRAGLPAE